MFKQLSKLAAGLTGILLSTCQVASASTSWTIKDKKIWSVSESGEHRQEIVFKCNSDEVILLVRDQSNTPIPQLEGRGLDHV